MTCPTLVLAGDRDWWLGLGLLRGIEDVVERPQVHVLRDASHWIQQDKCDADSAPDDQDSLT